MRVRLLAGTVAVCSLLGVSLVLADSAGARRHRAATPRLLASSPNLLRGMLLKPGVM